MPAVGRFLELLEAVSRRDWTAVSEVVQAVAENERRLKHFTAAHHLLQALDVATSDAGYDRVGTVALTTPEPTTPPPAFLHRVETRPIPVPVLTRGREESLRELIVDWQNESRLRAAGLSPRNTLLMYGPPGCGKTLLARYLAASLSMPLYLVRFDGLVSSFLGETASNLHQVFQFFAANRCVLLIDEIDAIAKLRDDRNELGELKRVVISLLQNIDYAETRSLLVAATNHPHLLDPALWRRFEMTWEVPLPTQELRVKILRQAELEMLDSKVLELLASETDGMSGAALVQLATDARRRVTLDEGISLEEGALVAALDRLLASQRPYGNGCSSRDGVVRIASKLRDVAPKRYSFKKLEALTGIPHSTIHHRSQSSAEACLLNAHTS